MSSLARTVIRRRKDQLRNYQVYMAKQIKKRKRVLLAVDMGLGKTAATLTAVRRLLDEFVVRKVLIVAPLYVAEMTWPEEIDAWDHLKALTFTVITGSAKKRLAALDNDSDIDIINRENLPWLVKNLGKKIDQYDMVVYDESRRLSGGKKRTAGKKIGDKRTGRKLSEFGAMAKLTANAEYIVELTGTPATGGLMDLWGQIYILDKGYRLGATKKDFTDRWFESDYMGYNYEPRKFAHKQIMSSIEDVMIGLRAEDHLELPPIVTKVIRVKLPEKIMKEYKKFERTLVSELYDVEAVSKGVLTNKLLQFANGSMYQSAEDSKSGKREVVKIHDAKLSALESVVSEANGSPVLVAYSFKFDLDAIRKRFPKAVVAGEDKNWKEKWDRGEIQMLLAHPASMGHGLNLQYGGYIGVWYGLTWSLELFLQFNKRLPRPGQKHHCVFSYIIVAAGTMDESVYEAMEKRNATQDSITEVVRVRIRQTRKESK